MKKLIFVVYFISISAYSQTDKFDLKKFPSNKFKVTFDTTKMSGFNIVLIVLKPIGESDSQYAETKVWIQRQRDNTLTEKYLGVIESERGVYRPFSQPILDTYIIVECGEYEGQINLIAKDGDFVTIPGYYYALNKAGHIYTRQANLDSLICHYDIRKRKATDLKGKKVTADNLLFNKVERAFWIE